MMAITSDMQGSLINRYSSYLREGFRGHQTTNREQKQCIYPFCPDLSSLSGVGWLVCIKYFSSTFQFELLAVAYSKYSVLGVMSSIYCVRMEGRVANLQTTRAVLSSPPCEQCQYGSHCCCLLNTDRLLQIYDPWPGLAWAGT